jgi:5,10-methylenetetrahydromethanopterin reductase
MTDISQRIAAEISLLCGIIDYLNRSLICEPTDVADIDGGLAQILASDGWLPDRPINVPVYIAGQGPKARPLAKEIADGLISLGGPAEGFATCLVSTGGTVLDDGEDVASPRAATAVKPLIALAYHHRYTTDPKSVKALPNGEAWLASVERADENVRHLSVHRGHNLDIFLAVSLWSVALALS